LTYKEFFKKLSEENNSPDFEKIKKEIVKFLQQVPAITQKYIVYSQNSSLIFFVDDCQFGYIAKVEKERKKKFAAL
jgi:hypothetical protein